MNDMNEMKQFNEHGKWNEMKLHTQLFCTHNNSTIYTLKMLSFRNISGWQTYTRCMHSNIMRFPCVKCGKFCMECRTEKLETDYFVVELVHAHILRFTYIFKFIESIGRLQSFISRKNGQSVESKQKYWLSNQFRFE